MTTKKPLSPESQRVINRVLKRIKICDKCEDFDPDGMFTPLEYRIIVLEAERDRLRLELDNLKKLVKELQSEIDTLKYREG
jgi:hypothetical protein